MTLVRIIATRWTPPRMALRPGTRLGPYEIVAPRISGSSKPAAGGDGWYYNLAARPRPDPGAPSKGNMVAAPTPRSRLLPFALLALLVTAGPRAAEFYTDWLWFQEVGFEGVFLRTLGARAALGTFSFVLAFGFLFANFRGALRGLKRRELVVQTQDGPRTITLDPGRLRPLVHAGAGVAALLLALYASSAWETWLFYLHATPFGARDPILGHDAAFYVFELPFLQLVQKLLLLLVALAALGVGVQHVAAGNLALDASQGLFVTRGAKRHLSLLASALLLLLAFGAWLRIAELLITPSGIVHGAGYVEVHARMPALRLLVVAACAGAVLAGYQALAARFWPILAAAALYIVVSFGGTAYAALIQRFVVAPNEQVRETPFIVHNVAATRAAFALDGVGERQLSGDARLTRGALEANAATLDNVPLWNDQPLLDTFGQIQEMRTYYDFVSVDNDRYMIDGRYRQIMLSARELNSASLPSRTWINERLTFTHGYGLTLGPVNQVTPEGLPVLFIKDLPPVSSVDLTVSQPAIYYGEISSDHAFVKTNTEEFDYPRGDDNVFTRYAGEGGVSVAGLWRRLLFALRFRSTDTLFAPNLTSESRVMLYRRISERVNRIAPFLTYDPDPYLAISDGRLFWIQDAYTSSGRYPYSTPAARGLNYIRNSVKVTIDAYHGTTVFHLIDPDDPIAATIARVFPGLFRPLQEMPEDLRSRLRYPHGIFSIQARIYATFHMRNPAAFYNKEDQWEIPAIESGRGEQLPMEPYYTIMKLPGETGPEYIQMLPFTPRGKDNLAAWMVARSDGASYGQLVAFQFPKQTVIFGPRQVAARISQDQVIAPQITLWNQQGSEVIQGTLLVIPIEEALLYIRPLYLRAAGGRIPELKRVIVAYHNQIVMEETLEAALDRLFPRDGRPSAASPPVAPAPAEPADAAALAARAQAHYQRAMQAQRDGDWALYGEEIRRLGEVLERLAARPRR